MPVKASSEHSVVPIKYRDKDLKIFFSLCNFSQTGWSAFAIRDMTEAPHEALALSTSLGCAEGKDIVFLESSFSHFVNALKKRNEMFRAEKTHRVGS